MEGSWVELDGVVSSLHAGSRFVDGKPRATIQINNFYFDISANDPTGASLTLGEKVKVRVSKISGEMSSGS